MITQSESLLLLALVGLTALLLLALVGVEVHQLFAEIVRDFQLTRAGS